MILMTLVAAVATGGFSADFGAVGGAVLAESAAPADLEKGLLLTIPPQERVVLVLENNNKEKQ